MSIEHVFFVCCISIPVLRSVAGRIVFFHARLYSHVLCGRIIVNIYMFRRGAQWRNQSAARYRHAISIVVVARARSV